MVLGEALDRAVRPVGQGDQPGRREDPGLAHPAADQLAGAARAPDDVAPADDDRADRAGEPLRQAERDGVGRIGQVRRADALGHDRVPEPGAVEVERDAVVVGDRGDLPGVLGGQRLAHRVGVGVLDGDEAGDRLVRVVRVAEGGLDLVRVDRPVGPVLERSGCSSRR